MMAEDGGIESHRVLNFIRQVDALSPAIRSTMTAGSVIPVLA